MARILVAGEALLWSAMPLALAAWELYRLRQERDRNRSGRPARRRGRRTRSRGAGRGRTRVRAGRRAGSRTALREPTPAVTSGEMTVYGKLALTFGGLLWLLRQLR